METTSSSTPEPDHSAAEDLRDLEEARCDFAGSLVVPRGYDTTAGAGSGLLMVAIALVASTGSGVRTALGILSALVGVSLLLWAVRRFRALNGAWVSGWRSGKTSPVAVIGAVVTAALLGIAMTASTSMNWWWVGIVLAPLQMIAFIVISQRWMVTYRREHGVTQ